MDVFADHFHYYIDTAAGDFIVSRLEEEAGSGRLDEENLVGKSSRYIAASERCMAMYG